MERYDYIKAMKEDIREYLNDNYTAAELAEKLEDQEEFKNVLNDDLWTVDSVTGNASGSYYCNAYRAEEAICHNIDLLAEAVREFCCDVDALSKGAEWCDVTIRCYLLWQAIAEVIAELAEEANA